MRPKALRFVLDVHLAKLARHLRMIGTDAAWRADFADPELARVSQEEGRILLTRDRALHDSHPPELRHFVLATDPTEQFKEVLTRFSLWEEARSHRGFLTRCLECNSTILPARGDQLVDRLPLQIRAAHSEFFLCPRCERIYWNGSHVDRMRVWIDGLS